MTGSSNLWSRCGTVSGRSKPGSPAPFEVHRTVIGQEDYHRLCADDELVERIAATGRRL